MPPRDPSDPATLPTLPICHAPLDASAGLRPGEAFDPSGACERAELWPCWGDEDDAGSAYRLSETC